MKPYKLLSPIYQSNCVLFNSPHSGSIYTEKFIQLTGLSLNKLRSSEDLFVDQLFSPVVDLGSFMLSATFPRSFIDVNRDCEELDPLLIEDLITYKDTLKVSAGLGVIPRVVADQTPIYKRRLSIDDARERLQSFYFPYHNKLKSLIEQTKMSFKKVILLDCHSMPQTSINLSSKKDLIEVVLGDCFGSSCEHEIVMELKDLFTEAGFKVCLNKPFSGGFITRNYASPLDGINVVQIEILRSLYSDEKQQVQNNNFLSIQNRLLDAIKGFITRFTN
jgi:N-formylglutamate deformylase